MCAQEKVNPTYTHLVFTSVVWIGIELAIPHFALIYYCQVVLVRPQYYALSYGCIDPELVSYRPIL